MMCKDIFFCMYKHTLNHTIFSLSFCHCIHLFLDIHNILLPSFLKLFHLQIFQASFLQ